MDFPCRLFGPIVHPPEILGYVDTKLLPENSCPVRVVAAGSHDAASAVAAAPLTGTSPVFISLGTWLLEECRRSWSDEGKSYDFSALVELARAAEPSAALPDTDSAYFFAPGDMVSRVRRACAHTGQREPGDAGEFARAILESLALNYRTTLNRPVDAAAVSSAQYT